MSAVLAFIAGMMLLAWPQAPPAVEEATLVEGKVLDSASKQPVGGARVILVRTDQPNASYGGEIYKVEPGQGEPDSGTPRMAVLTGIDGVFRFRINAPATFMLFVDTPGYVRTPLRFGVGSSEYKLKPGEPLTNIVRMIDAEASLSGRVIDIDTREGVQGLAVTPYQYRSMTGYRMLVPAGSSATTGDDGRYEIKGLPPGDYYLQVRPVLKTAFRVPAADEPFQDVEKRGYTRVYYPDVVRIEEATPVTVLPAAKLGSIDIRIAKRRLAAIRGRVLGDADASRDGQVNVTLVELRHGRDSRSFQVIASSKVNVGARFELDNLPPGTYELSAMTPDRTAETRQRAVVYFEAEDRNIDALDLYMQKGFTLTGRVRLGPAEGEVPEEQKPIPSESMRIALSSTKGMSYAREDPIPVNPQDGTFSIPGVFPDDCWVHVGGLPKGYKIAEVRYNNIPGDWMTFKVERGEERHLLEIVARPATSSVQVTVTDGSRPVAGAMVSLVREPVTETSLVYTARPATTDSEGRTTFADLLAGKYRVIAFPEGTLWRDDPGLASKIAHAQQVVLTPNNTSNIQIRVGNP
jgi:protocatechuate 3,4-dioxygenase beta subunit